MWKAALGIVALAALIAFGLWYEIASWNECLQTQSWWYCLRILGR